MYFLSSAEFFFFKIISLGKIFQEYHQSGKQFVSRSGPTLVGPGLGPNCLQRLSALLLPLSGEKSAVELTSYKIVNIKLLALRKQVSKPGNVTITYHWPINGNQPEPRKSLKLTHANFRWAVYTLRNKRNFIMFIPNFVAAQG